MNKQIKQTYLFIFLVAALDGGNQYLYNSQGLPGFKMTEEKYFCSTLLSETTQAQQGEWETQCAIRLGENTKTLCYQTVAHGDGKTTKE